MRITKNLGRLALGLGVACSGCLVPQDLSVMQPPLSFNRPPFIDFAQVDPQDAVFPVNKFCLRDAVAKQNAGDEFTVPDFTVQVVDLDVTESEQVLRARWFLDYDFPGSDPSVRPVSDQLVQPVDSDTAPGADRYPAVTFRNLHLFEGDLSIERPSTLEVVIVEDDALEDDVQKTPVYRALRDCSPPGASPECVASVPTTHSWTLDVSDEVVPDCP